MMMLLDIDRYPWGHFWQEARQLAALALPMMLASLAAVGVGVVDMAMAGAAGKDDLTAVALGSALFITVFITSTGIMAALSPTIAQMHGEGKRAEVGETGRQGLWFGLMLGLIGMAVMLGLIRPLQAYVDFAPHVETMLGDYVFYTALAMPAAMLYRALQAYASSLNRPKPIMWVSWAALLLNIPLNYVFVYGKLGLPAMGGAGCGLATLLVFVFNAAALGRYVWRGAYFAPFGLAERFSLPNWRVQQQIWRLGWPIGLSYFLEASLFTSIVWLAAPLGADTVAAQQVVVNMTSITYMLPQAVGTAATVRIGFALGRRRFARARYVAGVAVALAVAAAVPTLLVMMVWRYELVGIYTADAGVIAVAVWIALFAAVFQLFDFTQCVASYALRGYKVTRVPMLIHALAFWLCGLLPGYALAFWADMGITGFWIALVGALAFAAAALLWYLNRVSRWVVRHRGL